MYTLKKRGKQKTTGCQNIRFKTDKKQKIKLKGGGYKYTIKSINAKVTTRIKIQTFLSGKRILKRKSKEEIPNKHHKCNTHSNYTTR